MTALRVESRPLSCGAGTFAFGRFDPFAMSSGKDRFLRIPAEDRSGRIVFSNGSYMDGPLASVFISAVNGWRPSVICPACWRGLGPLALMKSDDPRLPIKGASFGLLTGFVTPAAACWMYVRAVAEGMRKIGRVRGIRVESGRVVLCSWP
jgi:hypothetical protein